MRNWVSWSKEPTEVEAEAWVVNKLKPRGVISHRFGVNCIVIEEPTKEEIKGAVVVTQIPVPRFVKLFKEPLLKLGEKWTLENLEEYSRQQEYGLEKVIQALRMRLSM